MVAVKALFPSSHDRSRVSIHDVQSLEHADALNAQQPLHTEGRTTGFA
jgi:hypothetical protein